VISTEHSLVRPDHDDIDVVALLKVIWRYRYFIALVAGICSAFSVFLALSTTPVFRAQIVVTQAQTEGMSAASSLASQFGGLASIAGINLGKGGGGQEARAVLRSRHLVEEFVRQHDLVKELLPNEQSTLWFAVNAFQEQVLSITEEEDVGTITIAIKWTDPVVAARWANQFVALANEMLRTRALEQSSGNIKYLNEQIAKTNVVEIQSVMYRLIENETKTNMLANARKEYAFAIVDPAVAPERRIWPRRTLMVLTGGVLGVLLGMALAFMHDFWVRYRMRTAP